MTHLAILTIVLLLFGFPPLRGQTPREPPVQKEETPREGQGSTKEQAPPQVKVIKGSEHPELIPDAKAYFIVLNHLSQTVGDPEQERVWLHHAVGLSDDDTEVLLRIMAAYKKEWDPLVKTYNEANEEAIHKTGQSPEPSVRKTFDSKRKELVANTRKDLEEALSREGAARFQVYVEREKRGMVVTVAEEKGEKDEVTK